jgi:PAS domain S-box-containing protein
MLNLKKKYIAGPSFIENNFQHPLFNDYPDAVFTLDLKGEFLSANKALIDLSECSEEVLLGHPYTPYIAQEDRIKALGHFKKTIKGELQNFDIRTISAKGTRRTLNVTNLPIVINQEVIGIHVIARDITATIKTQKRLDEYHYRITDILDSITDGFIALNRDWRVTYWNKAAERLLRMPRKHIIGKKIWQVYHDVIPGKFYQAYKRELLQSTSVTFEVYFSELNIWVEASTFPSDEGLSLYFKDITDRKHGEEQLQREKEKYLQIFNLSPLPQWVFDTETLQFLDVNNAAIKHYGYSKDEFLEMTIKDIRPAEDVKPLQKILKYNLKNNVFTPKLVRHLKKSGEIMQICIAANAVTFEGKAAVLVLAIDYTEKLKAEHALAKSEQRFKALVQDGSDLVAILAPNGNYKYVSPTSASILGLAPEFLIGKNAFDFIHKDDKEKVILEFGLLTEQRSVKITPFRFKGMDDLYHWIETIITDMTNDPMVEGIVANSRDITQRIEDEIKTEVSIERFNTVSKATSEAIWDWEIQTGKVIWNKGIKGIFGHTKNNLTRDWWYNHVHPEDVKGILSKIQLMIKNKRSRLKAEYRFLCADGTYKSVLDRAFLTFDRNGEPLRMIGSMQDITERINYLAAVEKQNKRLREIAWMQAHQVRCPLANIMSLCKILLDKDQDQNSKEESLQHLLFSAEGLDKIIKEIIKKAEEVSLTTM